MRVAAIVAAELTALVLVATSARVAMGQSPSKTGPPNSGWETSKPLARYEGTWNTTKTKKLDGAISCQVKQVAKDRWQGRFWGVWQQVPFDYTVDFAAASDEKRNPATAEVGVVERPAEERAADQRVRGTATIDGASYQWVGNLTPARFDIQFTGSRYEGNMELKRVADKAPQR